MKVYFVYPHNKYDEVIYTRPLKTFSKKEDAEEWIKYHKLLSKRIEEELRSIKERVDNRDDFNFPFKNKFAVESYEDYHLYIVANTLKDEKKFTKKELKMISAYSYHFHNKAPKNFHLFDEYKIYSERVY